MDRYTESLIDYVQRVCPYCGNVLEVFENDDMDNIICPECSSVMNICDTKEMKGMKKL